MKKLTDIIEATNGVHPDAVHVSDAGNGKYKVHAVGKNFSDGIKVGEHLSDSELDDFSEMGGRVKRVKPMKEDVQQVSEGDESHAQFQKYHAETSKLLKNIHTGLSKHYDNVTNKKGYNSGEAHWGHVGDIKEIHRSLQDIHDRILQTGEYAKPPMMVKMKEDVEPEADLNILVQLRKAVDILEHGTQGGADITFGDGSTQFVEGDTAKKLVEAIETLKPETRAEVTTYLFQSHDNLVGVYARLK